MRWLRLKASVEARKHAAAEAEEKALLDKLFEPSGVSDEEALRRVKIIIERAVANGLTEVQVYRFPNALFALITAVPWIPRAGLGTTLNRFYRGDVRVLGSAASRSQDTSSRSKSLTFPTECPAMSESL